MLIKVFIVLALIVIIGSLFSALYFLAKDKTGGERTVKALTLRIGLSITLFILLMLGYYFGLIGH
ncbi:twin transmembrane helix small protein [Methylotenera sp.]|uniref:twin transmembrane helix small protein n=1 Tax=Methylotenera sp. TaxID=2051956 RepID=UPI0027234DB1|nr:twin transmembrane helix small protein [Methylotenera sp.]MDO9393287.1 twin transmembrane helix small protein [Methylotenera sp.]MDP1523050.1 twin transmembrane helix small protein [Methylotenera sp.]MDP2070827.1 twin transmembrane helix small protein [Methylotenera sp.]MDP3006642.1 twin transmembrane helix small protein [Methylotenera sp.]